MSSFAARFRPVQNTQDAHVDVLAWLDLLDVQIPKPPTVALRWSDCAEIPLAEASDGDIIIEPDHPTRGDLASAVVGMVRDADKTFPGPWHWRRWPLTRRVSGWLYVTGITPDGGSSSMGGGDPLSTWRYSLPAHFCGRRPYLLGRPRWWWECIERQVRNPRAPHHRPLEPWAMGVCAACLPCPSCGALYDCPDDCASWSNDPAPELTREQA